MEQLTPEQMAHINQIDQQRQDSLIITAGVLTGLACKRLATLP